MILNSISVNNKINQTEEVLAIALLDDLRVKHQETNINKIAKYERLLHDIKSPLTAIKINLEIENERNKENQETYDAYLGVEVINNIISKHITTVFSINSTIKTILALKSTEAKTNNIKLYFQSHSDYQIRALKPQFERVFTNILTNALTETRKVKDRNKCIWIRVRKQRDYIYITVKNSCLNSTNIDKTAGLGISVVEEIIQADLEGEFKIKKSSKTQVIASVKIPTQKIKSI